MPVANHAKYGGTIYFHNADTLWVNLLIASELGWKERTVAPTLSLLLAKWSKPVMSSRVNDAVY